MKYRKYFWGAILLSLLVDIMLIFNILFILLMAKLNGHSLLDNDYSFAGLTSSASTYIWESFSVFSPSPAGPSTGIFHIITLVGMVLFLLDLVMLVLHWRRWKYAQMVFAGWTIFKLSLPMPVFILGFIALVKMRRQLIYDA